jgi:hypothetical protein
MMPGLIVRLVPVVLALLLTGCTTGVIGGGKPTVIDCDGKGMVSIAGHTVQGDCTKFKFLINVQ